MALKPLSGVVHLILLSNGPEFPSSTGPKAWLAVSTWRDAWPVSTGHWLVSRVAPFKGSVRGEIDL
jgi:hypothetical protein